MNTIEKPLVIDNGSFFFKGGYAGDVSPTHRNVFPSTVGRRFEEQYETYVGDFAQRHRGVLNLKYPIEHGIVKNWDDMEEIWRHFFYYSICVQPEQHPVLISEVPLNPKTNREKMVQTMFESFNIPAVHVALTSALTMYSHGKLTGIAVDSGDGVTTSVPIIKGYVDSNAINRMNVAGREITDFLANSLKGISIDSQNPREIFRDIKMKLCYVALDYHQELFSNAKPNRELTKIYELPDGKIVTLSTERFHCPEIIFQPSLFGMKIPGIHENIYNSIISSNISYRKELFSNIVLSGGNTKFFGFTNRMTKEITALAPPNTNINVNSPPERMYSVWIGGSILASHSTFPNMCITKKEYEESGPSIVHK